MVTQLTAEGDIHDSEDDEESKESKDVNLIKCNSSQYHLRVNSV